MDERISEIQNIIDQHGTMTGDTTEQDIERLTNELEDLKYLDSVCERCKGTGEEDSGGVYPWGEGITVRCQCQVRSAIIIPTIGIDKATKDYLIMILENSEITYEEKLDNE